MLNCHSKGEISVYVDVNIFYLDENPNLAALYHGDKHVVRMVLETAQILSTAHHVLDGNDNRSSQQALDRGLYRPSHFNHPTVQWVRELSDHYTWTWKFFVSLCDEFEFRRQGKRHKSSQLIKPLQQPPKNITKVSYPETKFNSPPLVMPEEFQRDDPVESYRDYYFSKWQQGIVSYDWGREMPDWLKERISAKR